MERMDGGMVGVCGVLLVKGLVKGMKITPTLPTPQHNHSHDIHQQDNYKVEEYLNGISNDHPDYFLIPIEEPFHRECF